MYQHCGTARAPRLAWFLFVSWLLVIVAGGNAHAGEGPRSGVPVAAAAPAPAAAARTATGQPHRAVRPAPRPAANHAPASPPATASAVDRAMLPAPAVASLESGAWSLELDGAAQGVFLAAASSAPAYARELFHDVDAVTRVRASEGAGSCGARSSCAITTVTEVDGVRTSAEHVLEFRRSELDGTLGARFLVLHELGHLVEHAGLSATALAAFDAAFRSSPAWRPCFAYEHGCVPLDELFADQFAIYASGEATSMTTYATPRLLDDASFERLLREHYGR